MNQVSGWLYVVGALLVAGTLVCFFWGIVAAASGGQTPTESYVLSSVLFLISIAAGWVIAVILGQLQRADREEAEQLRQRELERTARSAVMRSFRIMAAFGRIQELTMDADGHGQAELRTRARIVADLAAAHRDQTSDAVNDWRRFAEAAVDEELARVGQAQRGEPHE
ncbi:hypothetical protein [Nocardia beijingensis]|uniref:hypothetical protein n=1 Tax=Nocardia beijingensis TaxID=95162 RepID=UPI0008346D8F|nr:hypothetical protein [Nocardia beijingensis]